MQTFNRRFVGCHLVWVIAATAPLMWYLVKQVELISHKLRESLVIYNKKYPTNQKPAFIAPLVCLFDVDDQRHSLIRTLTETH